MLRDVGVMVLCVSALCACMAEAYASRLDALHAHEVQPPTSGCTACKKGIWERVDHPAFTRRQAMIHVWLDSMGRTIPLEQASPVLAAIMRNSDPWVVQFAIRRCVGLATQPAEDGAVRHAIALAALREASVHPNAQVAADAFAAIERLGP